ncbi:MAG: hypothetical protein H6719_18360 [Sandaracinaceae bacterium]|nr:hypothetical protein [Sandaracinaceae bacterium]
MSLPRSLLCLCLVGCAAAPQPRRAPEDRVLLRERPEPGARYRTHFEVRVRVYGRVLRASRVVLSTAALADADGATFDHQLDSGGLDRVDPRLVLPASRDALVGAVMRERRDPRGRRAGRLQLLEATPEQREQLEDSALEHLVGAPALPEAPLSEQSEWVEPASWAYRVGAEAPAAGRRELRYRVASLGPDWVDLAVSGALHRPDEPALLVEGELRIGRADALIGEGRVTGTLEGGDGEPAYVIRWRTRSADAPDEPFGDEPPADAARSRVLDVAACEARVAELEQRMDAIPEGMPIPPLAGLAQVAGGVAAPFGTVARFVEGGLAIDGRATASEDAVEVLATRQRTVELVYPGHVGPAAVLVYAVDDAPLAPLSALMTTLSDQAFFVIVQDPAPTALPPRFAPGTPAAIESLAEGLEVSELVSLASGTCSPFVMAWGAAANLGGDQVRAHHRETVPAALRECACRGVDVDLVDAVLTTMATGGDPSLRALPVPADLRPLRLGRRATLGDLARALAP